jgi:tetratricopeptide (TPR) repeat protein
MGLIYMNTGRLNEAILSFQKVVHDTPASYEGYFMLGQAYALQGNLANVGKMRDAWENAARLRPYNNQALFELGNVTEQLGDTDSAIQYYSRALKIAPNPEIESKIKHLEK